MAVLRVQRLSGGMMAALPSARPAPLAAYSGARMAGEYVYTCPAGSRAIIRGIDLYTHFAPEGTPPVSFCSVQVALAGGGGYMVAFEKVPVSHSNHWVGHAVMEVGDRIWVGTDLAPFTWQVSGAVMPIPPTG